MRALKSRRWRSHNSNLLGLVVPKPRHACMFMFVSYLVGHKQVLSGGGKPKISMFISFIEIGSASPPVVCG
jgi:hypothetical protein